jgi:hypothetical protein
VDAGEEREVSLKLLVLEHRHHVLGRDGALQLLTVELGLLDVVPRALALCKRLGARAVAACERREKKNKEGASGSPSSAWGVLSAPPVFVCVSSVPLFLHLL